MSAAPNRFLHADSAGSFTPPSTCPMPSTAKPKKLPISQAINALVGVKSADKPLLADVCSLYHNGGNGVCNASNKYLAARMGEAPETISRRLSRLVAAGWLLVDLGKAAGFARTLTPSPRTVAAYLPGTLLTDPSIGIDQKGPKINSPLLTKSIAPIDQTGGGLLTKQGGAIDQTADSLLIVKEEQLRTVDGEGEEAPLRSSLLSAEKKIQELESALEEMTYQRNQLRASLLAVRPDPASPTGATASAPHTGGGGGRILAARKLPYAESRYATPEGFTALASQLNYSQAYAPHYLAHIAAAAAHEANRDERGWQNFTRCFLSNDANSARGLVTTAPNDSAHANATTFTHQRPVSGAKPTGAGGEFARALAERRAGLSSAGAGHHGPSAGLDAG